MEEIESVKDSFDSASHENIVVSRKMLVVSQKKTNVPPGSPLGTSGFRYRISGGSSVNSILRM